MRVLIVTLMCFNHLRNISILLNLYGNNYEDTHIIENFICISFYISDFLNSTKYVKNKISFNIKLYRNFDSSFFLISLMPSCIVTIYFHIF